MSWYPDLGRVTMIDAGDHVRAVGWLSDEHPFPESDVPEDVVERIRTFAARWGEGVEALGWCLLAGPHNCELCGDFRASGNFGVPSADLLYVAPEMLLHYVEKHRYRAPEAFQAAILKSPLPGTDEYRSAVEPFRQLHQQLLRSQGLPG